MIVLNGLLCVNHSPLVLQYSNTLCNLASVSRADKSEGHCNRAFSFSLAPFPVERVFILSSGFLLIPILISPIGSQLCIKYTKVVLIQVPPVFHLGGVSLMTALGTSPCFSLSLRSSACRAMPCSYSLSDYQKQNSILASSVKQPH